MFSEKGFAVDIVQVALILVKIVKNIYLPQSKNQRNENFYTKITRKFPEPNSVIVRKI